ncbi:glycosyltransferase family 4 protein [Phragmitibacter flavus]|uniref:Glycosyltransferase family 4 protein n=1 Tax=Phragmitibacter flavus TaxID=2576071 RepID=A0A5R8K7V0_9BACT|nr:glycosyltransferase family 1 protein [Phragmitibacter flavus]TLD68416.1 glycosyltransferase family 4 protein [Phragmitibacter flavus]
MKILLVGNYRTDRQESMQRFAALLEAGLVASGVGIEVRMIRPEPVFGRLKPAAYGVGKWLGYLDKFLLFPWRLRKAARWADVVHVCDHSNAFYTADVGSTPVLVTCHDLLAVRGGLGEDTDCPASYAGRILQRWILAGLRKATWIACDSTYTQDDLRRLTDEDRVSRSSVVLLGLNQPFRKLTEEESRQRLLEVEGLDLEVPYLLCVGRNLRRKNRDGMLRLMARLKGRWHGRLVIAGEPLDEGLEKLKDELGVGEQVVKIIKPSHEVLEALYNRAYALLFLSRFEGFGWPVVEAQTCGCPVICSDRTSVPEVAGDAALVVDIDEVESVAAAVLKLEDGAQRADLIKRGLQNAPRFLAQRMMDDYLQLYQKLCDKSGR